MNIEDLDIKICKESSIATSFEFSKEEYQFFYDERKIFFLFNSISNYALNIVFLKKDTAEYFNYVLEPTTLIEANYKVGLPVFAYPLFYVFCNQQYFQEWDVLIYTLESHKIIKEFNIECKKQYNYIFKNNIEYYPSSHCGIYLNLRC